MQGMSLLIASAKIQIQKPHLRWPPQNPSLYNPFFFHWFLWCLWVCLVVEKIKEKERKFWIFCFVLCLFTQFDLFYFIFIFILWAFAFGLDEWMLLFWFDCCCCCLGIFLATKEWNRDWLWWFNIPSIRRFQAVGWCKVFFLIMLYIL